MSLQIKLVCTQS